MNGLVVCLVGLFLTFFFLFALSFFAFLFVLADSVLMLMLVLNIDPIPPDSSMLIATTADEDGVGDESGNRNINEKIPLPLLMAVRRLLNDDLLSDQCRNSEMRCSCR